MDLAFIGETEKAAAAESHPWLGGILTKSGNLLSLLTYRGYILRNAIHKPRDAVGVGFPDAKQCFAVANSESVRPANSVASTGDIQQRNLHDLRGGAGRV